MHLQTLDGVASRLQHGRALREPADRSAGQGPRAIASLTFELRLLSPAPDSDGKHRPTAPPRTIATYPSMDAAVAAAHSYLKGHPLAQVAVGEPGKPGILVR